MLPLSSSDFFFGRYRFDHLLLPTAILPPHKGVSLSNARSPVSDNEARDILNDHDSRVPDKFTVAPFFAADVRFWFGIYTQYDSGQIVLHDRDDLEIIYGVLHFDPTDVDGLNRYAKAAIMQSMAQRKIDELKLVLRRLAENGIVDRLGLSVLKVLQNSTNPSPLARHKLRDYFLKRAQGVRAQTGQRNLIEAGLQRASARYNFYQQVFKQANLPPELLAIAFLESSFNHQAHSRVGALGVWQFMPLIASYFMPKRSSTLDYRQNPIIATIAAMHLLRENFAILKRWDLAVTAYNSGTKHLTAARRELGQTTPSLENVFKHYQSNHHGFASKNFYSEFIALVHVLDYRDVVFPKVGKSSDARVNIALSLCSFVPKTMLQEDPLFADLNPHLYRHTAVYPRGTIVVSEAALNPKKFKTLGMEAMLKMRPIKWAGLIKNQSCSTR